MNNTETSKTETQQQLAAPYSRVPRKNPIANGVYLLNSGTSEILLQTLTLTLTTLTRPIHHPLMHQNTETNLFRALPVKLLQKSHEGL